MKYVSNKYAGDPNGVIQVPAGGSFADIVALRGHKHIDEKINIIISKLSEAGFAGRRRSTKAVLDQ